MKSLKIWKNQDKNNKFHSSSQNLKRTWWHLSLFLFFFFCIISFPVGLTMGSQVPPLLFCVCLFPWIYNIAYLSQVIKNSILVGWFVETKSCCIAQAGQKVPLEPRLAVMVWMRNVLNKISYLNTWCPVRGAVWRGEPCRRKDATGADFTPLPAFTRPGALG